MFARQDRIEAFLDQALPGPRHRGETNVERLHDPAVAPTLSRRRNIGFQQNARLKDRGRRPFPRAD